LSFATLARVAKQVAQLLASLGWGRAIAVLIMLAMCRLWETCWRPSARRGDDPATTLRSGKIWRIVWFAPRSRRRHGSGADGAFDGLPGTRIRISVGGAARAGAN